MRRRLKLSLCRNEIYPIETMRIGLLRMNYLSRYTLCSRILPVKILAKTGNTIAA